MSTEPINEQPAWITWVEPFGPNNEPVYMTVDAATAIAVQKKNAKQISDYTYKSDEDALIDFMVVNWASPCKDPRK